LLPQLSVVPPGQNLLLSWPTNFTGFTLQSTTNLASPIWTTNLPAPGVVNGLNTVTNPVSAAHTFLTASCVLKPIPLREPNFSACAVRCYVLF
jgi:hypothetical protein